MGLGDREIGVVLKEQSPCLTPRALSCTVALWSRRRAVFEPHRLQVGVDGAQPTLKSVIFFPDFQHHGHERLHAACHSTATDSNA